MNWIGTNGKKGLKNMILKEVILGAVRRNSFTAKATDGEIEKFAIRWLQLAPDRWRQKGQGRETQEDVE
ncbi:hypothetical protein SKAU_G00094040 [Synaphobranchus kaupii]|uniref:Uncharacterized protein n=1 Tax=Synaphobranchus kaupii TaxID=118154 RepID=A0A9Q1J6R0_SYNKA|nr:hypothetical protein SKAU_G00094040 [Synaphobranchus kaupii]